MLSLAMSSGLLARDQVRTIRFSFAAFIFSMRLSSRPSTNGPFLELLLI